MISQVAESFFYNLAFGLSIFTFLIPTKQTGAGLMKVMSTIAGVSLLLGVIIHLTYAPTTSPQSILSFAALLAYIFIYVLHTDNKSWSMWLMYALHTISLALCFVFHYNGQIGAMLHMYTGALLLGNITFAMVLGHWYLVTPKLSESPLKKAVVLSWPLLLVKVIITTYAYTENPKLFEEGTTLGGGYAFNWLMLTMRVLWGYVVILIMSIFSYRLVKMRSIQSATGVLYAQTFFILVGELISIYFFYNYGALI